MVGGEFCRGCGSGRSIGEESIGDEVFILERRMKGGFVEVGGCGICLLEEVVFGDE